MHGSGGPPSSKLTGHIDRAREGRLFNDWHYFTEWLSEQFNPRNARMEAYNKLLALKLTSDAPSAATCHVEHFRDLEGQVNLDDNELIIDLFRGSLTCSLQEKFEHNPPAKRNPTNATCSEFIPHSATGTKKLRLYAGTNNSRKPKQTNQLAATSACWLVHSFRFLYQSIHGVTRHQLIINSATTIQVVIGKHSLGVVEVSVADTADYDLILGFTELRRLQPTIRWDTGQLEFKSQDRKRPPEAAATRGLQSKVSKSVIVAELSQNSMKAAVTGGQKQELAIRDSLSPIPTKSVAMGSNKEKMAQPTIHGNEFISAKHLLQAALEDGPIGFMLLEVPPSSLPAFGFVPTSADKGVEMEVEIEKKVTAADIPKPYQHLRDVFDKVEADRLPQHTKHDLHLELMEGSQLPQGPLYLKGPKEMSELRKYLDENLAKGFIRPLKSPARSPVLFVPKKDGGLRLCVDYRGLNEITVKNRALLPLIEEQLFLLQKVKIYSKLDLRAAYNLICIAKGDEWKTAFGTQLGLYEYLVMPFGLANAPAHFQSFINVIF
ncbi:uncharacterized protein UHO2_00570 [Ustilago hordei]|uniref:uncharacterized protein n=1 Tax=Ustilago hordei TaxID=120017 RepID=UPI001A534A1E|nr:uncharacterized protein UHO2_00570 [Ustilago hordei]SYW82085.1 related to retrotransposon nucleocapsid protein [Ustilago hordei]